MKKFTIHDLPKIERRREKLVAKAPQNLKDDELKQYFGESKKLEREIEENLKKFFKTFTW